MLGRSESGKLLTPVTKLDFKKVKEKHLKLKDPTSGYDKELVLKTFQLPNGMTENFFIDKGKDSVQIFAITEDEQVLCVKQFRAGPEKVQLELPGGGLEQGEDIEKAAVRELLEETGFQGGKPMFLAALDYSPYSSGKRHLYMVTGCRKVKELDLDPNEFLEVLLVPMEQFRKLMIEGKVRGHDTAYMGLDRLNQEML